MRARKHETLAAAAGRIIELQDDPGHGVFLKFHVLADPADTDEEALRGHRQLKVSARDGGTSLGSLFL